MSLLRTRGLRGRLSFGALGFGAWEVWDFRALGFKASALVDFARRRR